MPEMVGGLVCVCVCVCVCVSVNFAHGGLFPYQYSTFKNYVLISVISLMHRNSLRLRLRVSSLKEDY